MKVQIVHAAAALLFVLEVAAWAVDVPMVGDLILGSLSLFAVL
jgi:hypothetical protein